MTAKKIKAAVDAGKTVNYKSGYIVVKTHDYFIKCTANNHMIGLTWADDVTLNGKEEDFTLAPEPLKLGYYQEIIKKATNCSDADTIEIENYMRDVYFESNLSSKTMPQLLNAAKASYKDILFMRSPEGQGYMAKIKEHFYNN